MTDKILIRPIKENEIMLLTDFIYEAIFQRNSYNLVSRTIIQKPEVYCYIDRFGTKADDKALVAVVDGVIVGAVWVRCIDGYGHIQKGVPEFAISLYPEYRNKGIGTKLMKEMLKVLKSLGYRKTSLAVQKENYAYKMYLKVGFRTISETNEEYIMVCDL